MKIPRPDSVTVAGRHGGAAGTAGQESHVPGTTVIFGAAAGPFKSGRPTAYWEAASENRA